MATTAQTIAELFGNDGQCFVAEIQIEEICEQHSGRVGKTINSKRQATLYRFLDDSAIVVAGDAWDYLHPDCSCGCCFEGASLPQCLDDSE